MGEGRAEVGRRSSGGWRTWPAARRPSPTPSGAVGGFAAEPGDPATFAALDELLDAQAYRLCFWRVASDEINYRRFFDVNELAALATERDDVFRAVHRELFGWLGGGLADGLRIDHLDGLYDPKQYLDRLQTRVPLALARRPARRRPGQVRRGRPGTRPSRSRWRGAEASHDRPLYVVVEKILARGERDAGRLGVPTGRPGTSS